jgi:hypothetical protein
MIACEFFTVDLDQAPPYIALSYTWGDPNDPLPIVIDGIVVKVTRNLHSALTNLREDLVARPLWVDAICIDQSDDDEKSKQVQLMGKIYQEALHVMVWLGPADDTSDAVMDYLNEVGQEALSCGIEALYSEIEKIWGSLAAKPQVSTYPGIMLDGIEGSYGVMSKDQRIGPFEVKLSSIHRLFYKLSDRHDASLRFPLSEMAKLFTRAWWS